MHRTVLLLSAITLYSLSAAATHQDDRHLDIGMFTDLAGSR